MQSEILYKPPTEWTLEELQQFLKMTGLPHEDTTDRDELLSRVYFIFSQLRSRTGGCCGGSGNGCGGCSSKSSGGCGGCASKSSGGGCGGCSSKSSGGGCGGCSSKSSGGCGGCAGCPSKQASKPEAAPASSGGCCGAGGRVCDNCPFKSEGGCGPKEDDGLCPQCPSRSGGSCPCFERLKSKGRAPVFADTESETPATTAAPDASLHLNLEDDFNPNQS
eukprot:GCRY01000623.1.p1 GENE.GCRY01000623.1~~GCRY01000623.1.p1  ORF type:complete len:220 (+),score=40.25 GCRY01000623.1:167-826(+)